MDRPRAAYSCCEACCTHDTTTTHLPVPPRRRHRHRHRLAGRLRERRAGAGEDEDEVRGRRRRPVDEGTGRRVGRGARLAAAAAAHHASGRRRSRHAHRAGDAGPVLAGGDRPVARRPLDPSRLVRHGEDADPAVVADARRRADRDGGAVRPARVRARASRVTRREAPAGHADHPRRADAEPRRRRALPAPQRTGHRHQPRRPPPADTRRPRAQGAARSPESVARVQPAQPELAHVGRQPSADAGDDLAAGRGLRRGAVGQRGAHPREEDERRDPRRDRAADSRADRPLR